MRIHRLKFLALPFVLLLATACFELSEPEVSNSEPSSPADLSETSNEKPTTASVDDSAPAEEMSFPEALKLKRRLAKELSKLEEELEDAKNPSSEQALAIETIEEIDQYMASLEEAQSSIEASLEFWRAETRKSFVGVKLPEVLTSSGTLYQSVTITRVDDEEIEIIHEGGTATIPIEDLTISLRKNLIHEPTVLKEMQ